MDNISILEKNKCCGCMGCVNSCPVKAVEMKEDSEGFIMPAVNDKCINCGKCVRACPVLTTHYDNDSQPKVYAVRAGDEIRAKSSSGGMFSLIANEIFKRGGYVCGAAFDENIQLKHIIIDSEDDMPKLRGSKYLQSDIGNVYKDIAKLLKKGKTVFFCGTPCQVGALKGVLGKPYENLYTMDILCHGVASQKIFSQYLYENFGGIDRISRVGFRDKELGWGCTKIRIQFKDGTEYVGSNRKDTYEMGFHSDLFIRKSCNDCKFAKFPRQGDITAGDFWGIAKIDPSQHDEKGTSMVFVNNEKGREIFDIIVNNNSDIKIKEYDFSVSKKVPNRLRARSKVNPDREKFFGLLKNNTLKDSVMKAKNSENSELVKKIEKQNKIISELKDKCDLYETAIKNSNIDFVMSDENAENISEISEISEYLDRIGRLGERYLVIISAKWSVGRYIDKSLGELLNVAGFKEDIVRKIGLKYVGAVYGGKTLFEKSSHENEVVYKTVVSGSDIFVLSRGDKNSGNCSVKINGKECSVNRRGLNIVVYDTQERVVLDSVSFDTATKEFKAYRKK